MNVEVTDYGIDHAQYFTGHGTAYTDFDNSALGAGMTFAEALQDALEQAASSGFDLSEGLIDANIDLETDYDTVDDLLRREGYTDDDMPEECELYYYVGLRW
jgi:hypothetical protein